MLRYTLWTPPHGGGQRIYVNGAVGADKAYLVPAPRGGTDVHVTGAAEPGAARLLDHFGSVRAVMVATRDQLAAVRGLGEVRVSQILEAIGGDDENVQEKRTRKPRAPRG